MKKVLITGGAGFIGSHLSRSLISQGFFVRIFDSFSEQIHGPDFEIPVNADNFEVVVGDIRDASLVTDAVNDVDVVFHLAAETGTGQSMYEIKRYVDVNDSGTAVLLECLANSNSKCKDFVLASSRSVYGEGAYLDVGGGTVFPNPRSSDQLSNSVWDFHSNSGGLLEPLPHLESTPLVPGSIYAATKISQELLVGVACTSMGIKKSTLRFQNVYGPGQSLRNPYTGIISIFYNRIRQGLPLHVFEDGLESRDFVYIDDVVDALIACMERGDSNHLTANIGSGVKTSILDLAEKLVNISAINSLITVTGEYRVGDIRHGFADITCARESLLFDPKIDLVRGLSKFCDWASKQPEYSDQSNEATLKLKKRGLA